MVDVCRARDVAAGLLAGPLPRRWRHVCGVARRADAVASRLAGVDKVVVAAAWLHDVGYSPGLVSSGFHPLDGARFLRGEGFDERVTALVAHHSLARIEAGQRGLGGVLSSEFRWVDALAADVLCYCDMTTSPDGEVVDVAERLAEIRSRYGPDDIVTRFVDQAEQEIVGVVQRTEHKLRSAGVAV